MPLHLCVECGHRTARPPKPCGHCGAEATLWKAAPVTLRAFASQLGKSLFGTALGAIMLFTAYILCTNWGFPSLIGRVLQVIVALVVVLFGGLTGLAMFGQAMLDLFERRFRHESDGRHGTARAILGFVREARGSFTRTGEVFAPGLPEVESVAVFANARELNLGRVLGERVPSPVDVAITTAILGLASRGRCELVLRTERAWSKSENGVPKPSPDQHHVLVKRVEPGRAPREHGFVEAAILTALDTFAVAATTSREASHGPYREKPEAMLAANAPVPVDLLIAALTGGRPKARSWLRTTMQREADGDPARSRLGSAAVATLATALSALFARAKDGGTTPSTALLVQVSRALSPPPTPKTAPSPG